VRARLLGHGAVQHELGVSGEGTVYPPGHGDGPYAHPPQVLHQPAQLFALPALAEQDGHVAAPHDPQVAVQRLHGVEEAGGRPGGGQRRGDLAADDAALADPGDDHPPRRGQDGLHRPRELVADAVLQRGDGLRLHADHAARALQRLRQGERALGRRVDGIHHPRPAHADFSRSLT
jgi:hypothetical protein